MQLAIKEAILEKAASVALLNFNEGRWSGCEASKFIRDAGMSPELFLFLLMVEEADEKIREP